MLPVIAIVGRANVGKSTLFNRFTRSRDALVADHPGLTRDRQYGMARHNGRPFLVIDTGGFEPVVKEGIEVEMARQTKQALIEADAVIFLVDGRAGLTPHDEEVSHFLRRHGQVNKPIILAVNKTEGMRDHAIVGEFHALGWGDFFAVSSAHGDGIGELLEKALSYFVEDKNDEDLDNGRIKVAIVGRPNVGKSTLINSLMGEERVIAFDMPGTTRDAIYIPFDYEDGHYTLIDTAGLRKRGKVFETVEKFSVVKTLQAILDAHVVVLLLDPGQEISEQDAHIGGHILESGRGLVLAVNKWDDTDHDERTQTKHELERRLGFLQFARLHFISALKQQGISALMRSAREAYEAATTKLSTPQLTRALIKAVEHHAPRRQGVIRPKLRYAHQGGKNPPVVVVHGNALNRIDADYKRYLEKVFREEFKLIGTPLRVEFRNGKNPYDEDR